MSDSTGDEGQFLSAESSFFAGGGRQLLIDELLYFCRYSGDGSAMLLTAAPGLGRSALLEELGRQLRDDATIVVCLSVTSLRQRGVMDCLLDQLDPEAAIFGETDEYLKRETLASCCDEAAIDGRSLVVVVDDADELEDELQRELLELPTIGGLQLLLSSSDDGLELRLSELLPAVISLQSAVLAAFDKRASRGYLYHRLAILEADEGLLDEPMLAKLLQAGEGSPTRINGLLERLMSPAAADSAEKKKLPIFHLLAVVVIVFGLFILWHLGEEEAPSSSLTVNEELAKLERAEGAAEPAVGRSIVEPVSPVVGEKASKEPIPQHEAEVVMPEAVAVSKQQTSVSTVQPSQPAVAEKAETAKVAKKVSPAIDEGAGYSVEERFLLAQPVDNYTIQIMGLSSKEAIERFRRGLPKALDIRLVQAMVNGRPWYVLVSGNYRNRREAELARSRLPQSLVDMKPWLRRMEGVQQQLRKQY
ncbi:SPOR domain-containing protein [Sinobacterium caligoides]|uniref:SPOR domain-containing protein n=1 Tax=Sinobacterium caligoides TaxID=933926 RepID=UPI0011CDBC04|nr:SPOR domain-containing protein [Sinobacterium caligoides]